MTTLEVVICREVKTQQELWGKWNEGIKRMKEQKRICKEGREL
jgi:hypothetical protein